MNIEFESGWYHGNENEHKWFKTIQNKLQQLFPVYPDKSKDNQLLTALLKEISIEFIDQKNIITFGDIARSVTNPSALFPVVYSINAYDVFCITINSFESWKEDGSCFALDLTVHFSRTLSGRTNPYSHEHEQVNTVFVIDEAGDILQMATKKPSNNSTCTIV